MGRVDALAYLMRGLRQLLRTCSCLACVYDYAAYAFPCLGKICVVTFDALSLFELPRHLVIIIACPFYCGDCVILLLRHHFLGVHVSLSCMAYL